MRAWSISTCVLAMLAGTVCGQVTTRVVAVSNATSEPTAPPPDELVGEIPSNADGLGLRAGGSIDPRSFAPGTNGAAFGSRDTSKHSVFEAPVINAWGDVAFSADLLPVSRGASDSGIWASESGQLRLIVRESDPRWAPTVDSSDLSNVLVGQPAGSSLAPLMNTECCLETMEALRSPLALRRSPTVGVLLAHSVFTRLQAMCLCCTREMLEA